MSLPKQTSEAEFLGKFKVLGYTGPKQKGPHPFMQRGNHKPTIPNPHDFPIGAGYLGRILRNAGISEEDWENA